jgi:hypothetical protein
VSRPNEFKNSTKVGKHPNHWGPNALLKSTDLAGYADWLTENMDLPTEKQAYFPAFRYIH